MPGQFEDGQARPGGGQADRVRVGAAGLDVVPSTRRTWIPAASRTSASLVASVVRARVTELRPASSASVVSVMRRPLARTTISSTVWATSVSRWLETSTVLPSAASDRSRPRIQRIPSGSSPFSGSSRMSTPGSPSRAPARLSRWRMPSE